LPIRQVAIGAGTGSPWKFAVSAKERLIKLAEAREAVVEDPDILGGTPVIRGTRIPVYDVAASVAAGLPRERIRSAYAAIDDRLIGLAAIYAKATPWRGRPRQPVRLAAGAKAVSERKVARPR
jgi:uncharacterized protein (DUF433 family)